MPAKLERCVKKVKAKGGTRDPWAVCVAALEMKRKKGGGWTKGRKKGGKK